jgi:hypothetical protein
MEQIAKRRLVSVDLDRSKGPPAIVVVSRRQDGTLRCDRGLLWALDPMPPDPDNLDDARHVASIIAVNAAEPE